MSQRTSERPLLPRMPRCLRASARRPQGQAVCRDGRRATPRTSGAQMPHRADGGLRGRVNSLTGNGLRSLTVRSLRSTGSWLEVRGSTWRTWPASCARSPVSTRSKAPSSRVVSIVSKESGQGISAGPRRARKAPAARAGRQSECRKRLRGRVMRDTGRLEASERFALQQTFQTELTVTRGNSGAHCQFVQTAGADPRVDAPGRRPRLVSIVRVRLALPRNLLRRLHAERVRERIEQLRRYALPSRLAHTRRAERVRERIGQLRRAPPGSRPEPQSLRGSGHDRSDGAPGESW